MLGNIVYILWAVVFCVCVCIACFFNLNFFFMKMFRLANRLDPDQARHFPGQI